MKSNDEIRLIVTDVVENEDGSADLTFYSDDKTQKAMTEIGVRLVLICAAYDLSTEKAMMMVESVGNALMGCRDVSVDDVVEMAYARQRELEQEPEVNEV